MKQLLWKTVWKLLKMLSLELPYDSAVSLKVYTQRELKAYVHKEKLYLNVHSNIIHGGQNVNQITCVHSWINKKWYTHIASMH